MGQDMVDVLNYCYLSQRLSSTQRCGVITLLFKKGDRMQMKNWRPITLLCVDYKIAAKAIANRLLSVLPSVIHPDQVCGIIGRHISAKTRLLQDIVDDLNNRGMGGAILSLDQEKAFDPVNWAFLLRVLLDGVLPCVAGRPPGMSHFAPIICNHGRDNCICHSRGSTYQWFYHSWLGSCQALPICG